MNIKGGLFIAIGMLVLAIGDNYIRFITDKIGLWQFHFMRSFIAIPLLILFSFNQNYKIIFPKKFKLVFYRTALMVISMLIYFGCLAFFPIAQVAAGLFTSPIFVIIFSRFIYRLHCSVNKALDKEKCDSYKKVRDKYEHFRARCSRKQPKKSSRKRRKEKGCVDPLMGRKLKCVIDVVPKNSRRRSFRFYKPMA